MFTPLKRIIRHMADFRNMYKITRLVQDESTITDDLVMGITDDLKQLRFPKEEEIVDKFIKQTKMNRYNTERIIEVTIEHDYLKRIPRPFKNQSDRLMVTYGKGHDLLYTVKTKRIGMYNEKLKHYTPFALLISFIALTAAIISLIR